MRSSTPFAASFCFVRMVTFDTAAMLGKASPRKPSVFIENKSSVVAILLVACGKKAVATSSAFMPMPLSLTRIDSSPPPFVSIVTAVAPASIAFSSNSFTTEAGLSTTSPAAMRFAV